MKIGVKIRSKHVHTTSCSQDTVFCHQFPTLTSYILVFGAREGFLSHTSVFGYTTRPYTLHIFNVIHLSPGATQKPRI